jgi:hypothetical protein
MRFRLISALASAFAVAASTAAAEPPAPPLGIYLDTIELPPVLNEAALDQAMGVKGVDGLVIVISWSSLEPGDGAYDWSALDQEVALAIRHCLSIELSIRADDPPGWLAGAGAVVTPFGYSGNSGCTSVMIASPWDPVFLGRWRAMLQQVAYHLKYTEVDGRNAYGDVTLLRLTGVNWHSDELHLPATHADDGCTSDDDMTWQHVHFSPQNLQTGWDQIVQSFKLSFGGKYFSVAIIDSSYPFPRVEGEPSDSQAQNQPLLEDAHSILQDRLVVQNNSLYADVPAQPETVAFALSLPSLIAFQTNLQGGPTGGAVCYSSGATCQSGQDYLKLLDTGVFPSPGLKANYIEVFAPNVNAFPWATAIAHAQLLGFARLAHPNPPSP